MGMYGFSEANYATLRAEIRALKNPILLDVVNGVETWAAYDPSRDALIISRRHDSTAIIEANKEAQRQFSTVEKHGDFLKEASIPLPVYEDLMARGIVGHDFKEKDEKAFKRWMNDSSNKNFRTTTWRY